MLPWPFYWLMYWTYHEEIRIMSIFAHSRLRKRLTSLNGFCCPLGNYYRITFLAGGTRLESLFPIHHLCHSLSQTVTAMATPCEYSAKEVFPATLQEGCQAAMLRSIVHCLLQTSLWSSPAKGGIRKKLTIIFSGRLRFLYGFAIRLTCASFQSQIAKRSGVIATGFDVPEWWPQLRKTGDTYWYEKKLAVV